MITLNYFTVPVGRVFHPGYSFELVNDQGTTILSPYTTYLSKESMLKGINSFLRNAPTKHILDCSARNGQKVVCPRYEIAKSDDSEKYRFYLRAKNGKLVCKSQLFTKRQCLMYITELQKLSLSSEYKMKEIQNLVKRKD